MSTVRINGRDVALEAGGLRCLVRAMGFIDGHRVRSLMPPDEKGVRRVTELVWPLDKCKPASGKEQARQTVIELGNGERRILPSWLSLNTPAARQEIEQAEANAAQRMYDAAMASSGSTGARRKREWKEAIQGATMDQIKSGEVEKAPLPRAAQAALDSSGKGAKAKSEALKKAHAQTSYVDEPEDLV